MTTTLTPSIGTDRISPANFDFLCRAVYDDSGIVLDQSKMYLIDARLGPLARKEGLDNINKLCDLIRGIGGRRLRDQLVDAMTTNETLFFRDVRPFDTLRETLIPEITSRSTDRTLRIWSAACSSGQEPYSIAMIWRELAIPNWSLSLLATDLSRTVLEQAKQGTYHQHEVNRGLPPGYLQKYFEQEQGSTDWTVKRETRSMIDWRNFNLKESMFGLGPFDLILCRNVLIYFDDETKTRIVENQRRVLKPGGYLMLGSTETMLLIEDRFERRQVGMTTVHQNPAG